MKSMCLLAGGGGGGGNTLLLTWPWESQFNNDGFVCSLLTVITGLGWHV